MAEPGAGLPTVLSINVPAALQNGWWVVLAAAIPPLASGLWVFWRWWIDRRDSHAAAVRTREQGIIHELELQRVALSKEQAELFDRIRTELVRCQSRFDSIERDRDRGWDLARWWSNRAHELRHAGLNAQMVAQNLAASQGRVAPGQGRPDQPPMSWPDMSLPELEDPR